MRIECVNLFVCIGSRHADCVGFADYNAVTTKRGHFFDCSAYSRAKLCSALKAERHIRTDFFTDLYIDANDTYFDAGRLYRTLRDSIADSAPLVGAFLPEWSLPNYITQAQLAKILGVPNTQVAMQEMSGYTITLSRQCVVHPDYAKKDYTYYQFPSEGEDAAVLVVGLPLKSLLFDDTIPVDVHVEIPAHGVNAALSGTLKAGVNSLSAPVSVISDSDIDSIVQLRERLEQFADLLGSALKAVQ